MRHLCAVVRLQQPAKAALPCVIASILALTAGCDGAPETGALQVSIRPPASSKLVSATLQRSEQSESTALSLSSQDGRWVANVEGLAVSSSYVIVARAAAEDGGATSSVRVEEVNLVPGKTAQVLVALRPSTRGSSTSGSSPWVDTFWVSADEVDGGDPVDLRVSAGSDDPTAKLTYVWAASCGKFVQTQGQSTTWIAPESADSCQLTVTVSDAQGKAASATAKVQVGSAQGSARVVVVINDPPQISGMQSSPAPVASGTTVTLSVSASDSDGDALAYHWRCSCPGRFSDPAQTATTFEPALSSGTDSCTFSVDVTDGRGGLGTGSLVLSAKQPLIHVGPTMGVTVQSSDVAGPGDVLALHAQASTPDDGPLTWRWSASAGSFSDEVDGASASDIRWIAPATATGHCAITAVATDAWGTSASYVFDVKM
jgi:hypothetical protein